MGTSAISVMRTKRVGSSARKRAVQSALLLSAAVLLASCANKPPAPTKRSSEYFPESKYGVKASPRVVEYGQPVPQGGGRYMVGKSYTVKGRVYTPKEDKRYTAVGYASWYGMAFHGRYTANGEVYDMDTLSAAHPTMPLPSYARVTNVKNGSSIIVRVNDRGPYERDRIIDLSATAAELLDVRHHGSAKVKVEYVGPARMEGHDRQMLLASYVPPRTGVPTPALRRMPAADTMIALQSPSARPKLQAPTSQPSVVLAMVPIPRSRPGVDGGLAIDPYNYEIQAASLDVAPARQAAPAAIAVARNDVAPAAIAQPTVVQASAAGDAAPANGSNYGERLLGTYTLSEPVGYAPEANAATGDGYSSQTPRSARSSYAEDALLSPAQIAAETMAAPRRDKLQLALNEAIARRAAERSADLVEIQVGVFASADNAAAMGTKLASLGHVRVLPISINGRSMQAVRLVLPPTTQSDEALKAVADAGARGAFVMTR